MEASMTNAQDERGKPTSRVATTDVLASPRTDYDIELAREAQAQFLSRKFPDLKTLSYAGICVRAGGVGGDYCDFLSLPYQCFRLVVGDIAGKSVAAELQMANLQATLRSLGGPLSHDRSVSEMFSENTSVGGYATLFFGEYSDRNRRLRYANCGYPAPFILRSDNMIKRLESGGRVLGLIADRSHAESQAGP
jgi:sigma-B regulation protein RsbU (phosphoserine phosphatase)